MSVRRRYFPAALAGLAAAIFAPAAAAQTFTDVSAATGVDGYERTESARFAALQAFQQQGVVDAVDLPAFPMKARGAPGVALLDYDGDGDVDIYVTNGPGTANSLYQNQLKETGNATYVDVAAAAGVEATAQDSQGVCFADTDNDGDPELLVLGFAGQANHFYENNGDGTFTDVTADSDIGGEGFNGNTCSFGDFDLDGKLDVVVANVYDITTLFSCFVEPFTIDHPNNLYMNTGDNTFVDASVTSGIREGGPANMSWAAAAWDYDDDGDQDVLFADDQCAIPPAQYGGIDRGLLRLHNNDGTGVFTDVTHAAGLAEHGGWMGLSFADLDRDGDQDFFAANFGDYLFSIMPLPNAPGDNETRWFYNNDDGTFTDSGAPGFPSIPFAWGTSTSDYDNDGDFDAFAHGGLEVAVFTEASNPGTVLNNDGAGNFTYDAAALAGSGVNHSRRLVHGMAMGDLNGDGFDDIVSVSDSVFPEPVPLVPLDPLGGPFDATAFHIPQFIPIIVDPMIPPDMFAWAGFPVDRGNLVVEYNDATNGNNWLKVRTRGSVDTISAGAVNRDGIGAVVTVTPRHGVPNGKPIMGGSSYASQDALATTFGLGSQRRGHIDVSWPGGVKNKVYNVRKNRTVLLPEIPCSYDANVSLGQHIHCLATNLHQLKQAGVINLPWKFKLFAGNLRAYIEHHYY